MSHPYPRRASKSFSQRQSRPGYFDLQDAVERALQEILQACENACEARRSAPEGTPEWHKRTGEILAYGNLTHIFSHLKENMFAQEVQR